MFTSQRLSASCFLLLSLLITVFAQGEQSGKDSAVSRASSTVTVSATAERVRFTAPSNVVRTQLQVISENGQILFDVSSKGNVLDWSLQDSNGQRLQGAYLTVVTVTSLSGRISERLGAVSVADKQVELKSIETTALTAAQQQAVGPIEENGALTILNADEARAITAVANDGKDGQLVRSSGALSFRIGDFYSGKDIEQMRLTEEGNLGIGTDKPQAKLDVAGVIRTSNGIEFANGPDGTNATKLMTTATGSLQQILPDGTVVPNATGTGTQNKLAKWTDSAGALGDSVVTEASGNIGIGTSSPQAALHVIGNQFLKPVGATPTYKVLAGSDPTSTVMLTTDSSVFGWQIAPSNAPSDTIVQVLGQSFASVPNRGEFGIYLGTDGSSAFKVVQRGGPEIMRVTRSGNVGIGNTAPGAKLDVTGNINAATQYNILGSRVLSVPGINNAFVGVGAGNINSTGQQNSFFGANAGSLNTTGNRNSLFGSQAGMVATNGANSFFGYRAGFQNTTGGFNSFFGDSAGNLNVDGNNNTAIGSGTTLGSSNLTNATAIGALAQVDANNSLILGSIAGVNGSKVSTNVGIGTTSPSAKLDVRDGTGAGFNGGHVQIGAPISGADEKIIRFGDSGCGSCVFIGEADADDRLVLRAQEFRFKFGNVLPEFDFQDLGSSSNKWGAVWAVNGTIQTSDVRLKQGIANLKYGLDQVMQLRPVSFRWKAGNDKSTHLGLIAQEVDTVLPEAVQKSADADAPLGMNYSTLIPVLIKAIQEQQATLERTQAEIKTLRAENEALSSRIVAIEPRLTAATSRNKAAQIGRP